MSQTTEIIVMTTICVCALSILALIPTRMRSSQPYKADKIMIYSTNRKLRFRSVIVLPKNSELLNGKAGI